MAQKKKKVFVLDTNVYLHDPNALFNFEEHDIYVPIMVMREINAHKSNPKKPEVAKNARMISRYFFQLKRGATTKEMEKGFPLSLITDVNKKKDSTKKGGRVFFEKATPEALNIPVFPDGAIIKYADDLQKTFGKTADVIFVTQDILADILALSCGVQSEEYQSGKALDDIDLLYSGVVKLPEDFWKKTKRSEPVIEGKFTCWDIETPLVKDWFPNLFLFFNNGEKLEEYTVQKIYDEGKARISTITDYRVGGENVWGIHAKNMEQNFYINALMNPNIDVITGAGKMGSGKTILSLAVALELTTEKKLYRGIVLLKEATPAGEEIGFFPGKEADKMAPWMKSFTDNLDVLMSGDAKSVSRYIEVTSVVTTQGRTFPKRFLIIDEAQNLLSKQIKTLIGRAGIDTKVVVIGNLAQIETPYLTAETCGLTHAVEGYKPWEHSAHVTLLAGERSRASEYAADHL